MPLTDTAARQAKPRPNPYRLADGHGLYLEVVPSGSRYWRLKYRFAGKEKRLAIGVYPPDFVSFRRRAGALSAGAARRHRALGRSRPPSLWRALFGNATKSAGCADWDERTQQAQT